VAGLLRRRKASTSTADAARHRPRAWSLATHPDGGGGAPALATMILTPPSAGISAASCHGLWRRWPRARRRARMPPSGRPP